MITINKPSTNDVPLDTIPLATFFEGTLFGFTGLFYKTSLYGVVYINDPSVTWSSDCTTGTVSNYRSAEGFTFTTNKPGSVEVDSIQNGTFFTGSIIGYEGLFLKTKWVLLLFHTSFNIFSWGQEEFSKLEVTDYCEVDVRIDL